MIVANVRASLLEALKMSEHELIQYLPLTPLGARKRAVSPELQRLLLTALIDLASDDICTLFVPAIADSIGVHFKTAEIGLYAMEAAELVWRKAKRNNRSPRRGIRWDTLAHLMDLQDGELPETSYKAHQDSIESRRQLLERCKLAGTRLVVENLALRTLTENGKPISSDLQRQVLDVFSSYEPDACPLSYEQLAEHISQNGLRVSPRSIRRVCNVLVRHQWIWQSAVLRVAGSATRFIRWDHVRQMIPARQTWHTLPPEPTLLVEKMRRARADLLNAHGEDAECIIGRLQLRPASSATTIVGAEAQRALLQAIARHPSGCRMTCAELASQVELHPRTVQHGLAALLGQRLIDEHVVGNSRARIACWNNFAEFLPLPHERELTGADGVGLQAGQIMLEHWLGSEASAIDSAPSVPTLRSVFDRHVMPQLERKSRSARHVRDIALAIDAWEQLWPLQLHDVRNIRSSHVEQLQQHLRGRGLSHARVNGYSRSIRQVLMAAHRQGIAERRINVPMLREAAAPKFYLRPADIERLWQHCDALTWPQVPGLATAEWWRCALLLYWLYGFRTQELIAFARGMTALTWSAVSLEAETPNPHGTAENEYGWLTYIPQKQSWAKPEPLYLPLTRHARAAIDRLARVAHTASSQVFPWPRSQRSYYRAWNRLQELAGVVTKAGGLFHVKALRKSAATYLEKHHRGLGAAVCGWADRETSSAVMSRHYESNELMLVERLADYPVPACFDSLLEGERI